MIGNPTTPGESAPVRQTLPAAAASPGPKGWWEPVFLGVLVAAAFGRAVFFDLVWDDHYLVVTNPFLRGQLTWQDVFASPTSTFLDQTPSADRVYRPLLALSVAGDRALWGEHAGPFHLTSVLAHLGVALLTWRLAWRLTGSRAAALAAGALLAVHPSAVEPVAFLSARMDLFVGLGMAAVLLLLRGSLEPGRGWRAGAALACFAFALASKETAVAIPAIVSWGAWAYPGWFAADAPPSRRTTLVRLVIPFWVLLALYAVLRYTVIGVSPPMGVRPAEIPTQLLRPAVALWTWAKMTLLSRPVTGFIRVEAPTGVGDGRVLAGVLALGLLLTGLMGLRRRHPGAALALGWYAAALVPVSNLLPIYVQHEVYAAERSLYPALVGWCLFLAVAGHALLRAARDRLALSPRLAWAIGGAALATFLGVTAAKVGVWKDDVTLWSSSVASDPGSALAYWNLSWALAHGGELGEAEAVVREAAARFPKDPRILYIVGRIAELRGQPAEALQRYDQAIALGLQERDLYRNGAVLAAWSRDRERAGRWFALAAERYPQAAWPHVGLGWYYERQGQPARARAHFDRAAALEPRSPERPWTLCRLLVAEGRRAEAAEACREALAMDPSFLPARWSLAFIAEGEGGLEEAMGYWRQIAASLLTERQRRQALAHLHRLEVMQLRRTDGSPR